MVYPPPCAGGAPNNFAEYCMVHHRRGIVVATVSEAGHLWGWQSLAELSLAPPPPPRPLTEIWFADLAGFDALLAPPDALRSLTDDERQRAERMAAPGVRVDFLLSRLLLRRVLGVRCGVPGARLEFTLNPHGKPALAGEGGTSPGGSGRLRPHFNLAHSRGAWLLGVSSSAAIGVDIERPRRVDGALRLADRVFTAAERRALRAAMREDGDGRDPAAAVLAAAVRDSLFLRCWTRKEAVLKALGSGFAAPAGDIEVSTDAQPRRVPVPHGACAEVRVASLELPVAGFAAWALQGGGEFPPLRCYRLRP